MAARGVIRSGIGGWTFEPWRGVFYPEGLKQADELKYAGQHLTTIEINSTYYSSQKPESFAKWAATVPDGFIFSVKASRFCTNRKVLAEAAPSIDKFINQGISELGDRLGPILWQFMATKKFEPTDFENFLKLLPDKVGGIRLRHCIEARSASFADPAFVALCRKYGVAICVSENEHYPMIPDVTADFIYARLLKGSDQILTAYEPKDLKAWAKRFVTYAEGGVPGDLDTVDAAKPPVKPRDAFVYFIHEGKVRAPAAAQAFMALI